MKITIILITLLSIFLIGCGSDITSGKVTEKEHQPARTYIYQMPVTQQVGKTTITTYIPIRQYDDEDWLITFAGIPQDSNELESRTVYVTQEQYNAHKIGDDFRLNEDGELEDEDTKVEE